MPMRKNKILMIKDNITITRKNYILIIKTFGGTMTLRKWNYETHKYEEYTTPTEWDCRTYCDDMSEMINCCQCGKKIAFGDTYSSQEVHNFIGLGYSVCENCHEVETEIRFKNN